MNPLEPSASAEPTRPPRPPFPGSSAWWRGRSEVFVGVLTIGIGGFLGVQTLNMHVPDTTTSPGPQLFPALVALLTLVLGAVLIAQVIRKPASLPEGVDGTPREGTGEVGDPVEGRTHRSAAPAAHSDWRAVGIVLSAVTSFVLLLQPLGWLLSGALLFFGVSWAFGGRRPLFEISVALVYSSIVQLAFVGGLDLNLPSGILGGVF